MAPEAVIALKATVDPRKMQSKAMTTATFNISTFSGTLSDV